MKTSEVHTLDRILQCAIVLNWRELMRDSQGSVDVEYRLGPGGSLQDLRVLSPRPRGGSKVVCEYRSQSSPSRPKGLAFADGFESNELATMVEFIMRHEHTFPRGFASTPERRVQVQPPTKDETTAALLSMGEVMTRFPERIESFSD